MQRLSLRSSLLLTAAACSMIPHRRCSQPLQHFSTKAQQHRSLLGRVGVMETAPSSHISQQTRSLVTPRAGDWSCPVCNFCNFQSRLECKNCAGPRPEDATARPGAAPNPLPLIRKRAGDWTCKSCSFLNFASRSQCKTCGAAKSEEPEPDGVLSTRRDWMCAACAFTNFGFRDKCIKCLTPRTVQGKWSCSACTAENEPSDNSCVKCGELRAAHISIAKPTTTVPRAQAANTPLLRGDWICSNCTSHNFAKRLACFGCGAARPATRSPSSPGGEARPLFTPKVHRPGDWTCAGCHAVNFAFRKICVQCRAAKPDNASAAENSNKDQTTTAAANVVTTMAS